MFGYARSKMTNEEFKEKIRESLPCRISAAGNCDDVIESFLERLHYVSGLYDDPKDFKALDQAMAAEEAKMGKKAMRIFYLSIPPSIFVPVAQNAARECSSSTGETRVIVEKPFGRDLESSRELTSSSRGGSRRGEHLPHRPLPRQGAHREHHRPPLQQHHVPTPLVPGVHPQRADLLLRELWHRGPRRVL